MYFWQFEINKTAKNHDANGVYLTDDDSGAIKSIAIPDATITTWEGLL